ncbi:MAG TPA: helix-turn-helix domain-containing protein [Bryobacteraceae bacterium]|nr:helix-turn-helix domain-containing protein [Bryobacteraceae bacterium]
MVNFGEWIEHTRIQKGLTEEQCRARAGMTQPNWSRLVNSPPHQPRKSTMEAVARALEAPLSLVMAAAGYEDAAPMDVRLARRLEPLLMQAPPSRRPAIEAALEQVARAMVAA